jgi:excisionase family DNA binding protein
LPFGEAGVAVDTWVKLLNLTIPPFQAYALDSARCASRLFSNPERASISGGVIMDQENQSKSPKLGWTFEELASSLSVSVPFLRLEVKRGRLKAAHLGRRVVLPDRDVQRYLAEASDRAA